MRLLLLCILLLQNCGAPDEVSHDLQGTPSLNDADNDSQDTHNIIKQLKFDVVDQNPIVCLRPKANAGKAISIEAWDTHNGARGMVWDAPSVAAKNQQFERILQDDGSVVLRSSLSGKCLSTSWEKPWAGIALVQWDCTYQNNQRFFMVNHTVQEKSFRSKVSSLCLDLLEGNIQNGGILGQNNCQEASVTQRFLIDELSGFIPSSLGSIEFVGPGKFEPANGKKLFGYGQTGAYDSQYVTKPFGNIADPGGMRKQFKDNILPGIKGLSNTNVGGSKLNMNPVMLSQYVVASRSDPGNLQAVMQLIKDNEAAAGSNYLTLLAVWMDVADAYEGKLDILFQNWGKFFKTYPEPIFIRPLYEMGPDFGDAYDRLKKYCTTKNQRPCVEAEIAAIAKHIYFRFVWNMQFGASGNASISIPNVAFVWHVLPTGDINKLRLYYPDNGYGVDWIGTSWFGKWMIDQAPTLIQLANEKNKSMVIAESGPLFGNVDSNGNQILCDKNATSGPKACGVYRTNQAGTVHLANSEFFDSYFNAIEKNDRIKAFVYVGDDLRTVSCTGVCDWHYSRWGDFRIQSRSPVLNYFAGRLSAQKTKYWYQSQK